MKAVDETRLDRGAITGMGQSAVGRRLFRSGLDLTLEASLLAIEDAGLARGDIDGLAAYPGGGGAGGFAGPSLLEVQDALRLQLSWYTSGIEVPAQLSPVINAFMAVATGMARHVLVYRTVTEGSARAAAKAVAPSAGDGVSFVDGPMQWLAPYGVIGAPTWYALYVRRYMHEYGLSREQLAAIPISARTKSALNPKAVYRDPLTMEEYLGSRMIADPLCLFDCDVPCDGSTSFVVSRAEHVASAPHAGIQLLSAGMGAGPRMYRDQLDVAWWGALASEQMWARTDVGPDDVDVAQLYDGFSFITLSWLESMGFCRRGEAGGFVEGGDRIAIDGDLPLNTGGGQLAAGRLHGLGLLHEACTQLRHVAGERQVPGAEIAVVATGGIPNVGCMLLARSR